MSLGPAIRIRSRTRFSRQLPRLILVLTVTGAVILVLSTFGTSILQVYRLEREAARLARIKQGLQEQNTVLREEIRLLHTPASIEQIAREQLGLVKPGEIAVLIVRPPAHSASAEGIKPASSAADPLNHNGPDAVSWSARVKTFIIKLLR